tara:strand:- start:904 stop:1032 length:129 start_codon:yes stop_codon:yes gene_type:complete
MDFPCLHIDFQTQFLNQHKDFLHQQTGSQIENFEKIVFVNLI